MTVVYICNTWDMNCNILLTTKVKKINPLFLKKMFSFEIIKTLYSFPEIYLFILIVKFDRGFFFVYCEKYIYSNLSNRNQRVADEIIGGTNPCVAQSHVEL